MSKNSYAIAHYVAPAIQNTRRIGTLIAIFVSALLAHEAFATDYVWTTGSGYWTNPVLWGVASYPGQLSSADTATWTNTVTLTVTENTSLTNATVYFRNPANAVTLQMTNAAVLTVTNAFLIGDLSTSTGSVILAGSGTLAVTNGGTAQVIIGNAGSGTLTLNGGNLIADQIISTNNTTGFGSQLALGANAASGSVTVLNGSLWNVCTNTAFNTALSFAGTWNFLGGTHTVSNVADSSSTYLDVAPASTMTVAGSGTVFNDALRCTGVWPELLRIQGALVVSNRANMVVKATGANSNQYYNIVECAGPPASGQLIKVDNATLSILNSALHVCGYYGSYCSGVGIIVTNNGVFNHTSARYNPINFGSAGNSTNCYGFYIVVNTGGSFTNQGLYMGQVINSTVTVASGGKMIGVGTDGFFNDFFLSDAQSGSKFPAYGSNSVLVTGVNSMFSSVNNLWLGRGDSGVAGQSVFNNSLIVSNGGAASLNIIYVSTANNSGVTSTNNLVIVDGGYLYATNVATSAIVLGKSNAASGSLTIRNGGLAMTKNLFAGMGTGTGIVTVTSGGVLEANFISNNATAGSYVTNNGGVYQFSTVTPTIAPGTYGSIAIHNAAISFRGVTAADVVGNWGGTDLTNIMFSGANAFRLNTATNTAAANQSYVFDPGLTATNYAGLEMVNGATRYRGLAGNTLTIGQSVGSGGTMLCSNTTAVVDLVYTNNGTLTLFNSTLTFGTNATSMGHCISTPGICFRLPLRFWQAT